MPVQFSPAWSPKTALFLAYATTMSLPRAIRIMSLHNRARMTIDVFASLIVDGIPNNFFLLPLPIPRGPRFVIHEGAFIMAHHPDPNQPQITPEDLRPYLDALNPARLQTGQISRARTLNSFMACRTFLAPLFPYIFQKDKSRLISNIWEHDPFKPQWTVLAKAYSRLREHFDLDNTRLSNFIDKTKGFFNFPTPEQYLAHVGWKMEQETWQRFTLTRTVPHDTFQLPSEAVSEVDIIDFCTRIAGYTTQKSTSLWPYRDGFTNTMAINHRNTPSVPLLWSVDANGNLINQPPDQVTMVDIYDILDPSVEDDQDVNVLDPIEAVFRQRVRYRARDFLHDVNSPAYNERLPWESWNQPLGAHEA